MHLMLVLWLGASRPLLQIRVNHTVLYSRQLGETNTSALVPRRVEATGSSLTHIERQLACLLGSRAESLSDSGYSCFHRDPTHGHQDL